MYNYSVLTTNVWKRVICPNHTRRTRILSTKIAVSLKIATNPPADNCHYSTANKEVLLQHRRFPHVSSTTVHIQPPPPSPLLRKALTIDCVCGRFPSSRVLARDRLFCYSVRVKNTQRFLILLINLIIIYVLRNELDFDV